MFETFGWFSKVEFNIEKFRPGGEWKNRVKEKILNLKEFINFEVK